MNPAGLPGETGVHRAIHKDTGFRLGAPDWYGAGMTEKAGQTHSFTNEGPSLEFRGMQLGVASASVARNNSG